MRLWKMACFNGSFRCIYSSRKQVKLKYRIHNTQTNSEPSQTFKMECFTKIVNSQPFAISYQENAPSQIFEKILNTTAIFQNFSCIEAQIFERASLQVWNWNNTRTLNFKHFMQRAIMILFQIVRRTTTKHGWELTQVKDSHSPNNMPDVTHLSKQIIISPLPQDLQALNLATWLLRLRGSHPPSYVSL